MSFHGGVRMTRGREGVLCGTEARSHLRGLMGIIIMGIKMHCYYDLPGDKLYAHRHDS